MEQERIFRLSIPGIVFLGSLLLFYLSIGGSYVPLYNLISESTVSLFVAIVITVPTMGLIISSITVGFLLLNFGYKYYLNTPIRKEIRYIILDLKDPLNQELEENPTLNKTLQKFYFKYQTYIRINTPEETIKFLQRRWNYIWIHSNNISAIILSLIMLPFLNYPSDKVSYSRSFFIPIIIFFIIYLISAFKQIRILRKEVIEIEEESVYRTYYSKK